MSVVTPQMVGLTELFAGEELPHEPQQQRSRATRATLLQAAAELFAQRGFSNTTTAQIADRAGVGVGTLYFYFRDKRQLLVTMLADTIAQYPSLGTVDADALRADPRAYLHAELSAAFPYSGTYAGLVDAVSELTIQDPDFRVVTWRINDAIRHQVQEIIRIGREAGLTHPDLDAGHTAPVLALVLYSFYNLLLSQVPLDEEAFTQRRAAAIDMVHRAVFAG